MANLPETPQWQDGIYQIETSDPVLGGPDGISNRQAKQLASRTSYLKQQQGATEQSLDDHIKSRNHPDGTLTAKGFVQLSSATNSTSELLAATPKAVKAVSDAALKITNNLSDLTNKSAARGALELGNAATRFVGTAGGQLMEVGAFGLGRGAKHKDDAYNTIGEIYRVNNTSASAPGGSVYGVLSLPCDAGPSAGYFAASNGGSAWIGYSNVPANGVKWNRVYTDAFKPSATDVGAITRADAPVGIPQPWPTATAPTGWLKCNGATFDKAKYPLLAVAYPNGKLPDLRGEFIRGADDGRGADVSRALLSAQSDAVQKFTGKTNGIQHFVPGLSTEGIVAQGPAVTSTTGLTETTGGTGNGVFRVEFDASRQIRTADETRPRNIAFNYIVRAA